MFAIRILGSIFALQIIGVILALPLAAQPPAMAEIMPLAHRSTVLGLAQAGDRFVAVGERGHILVSEDFGRTWRQVPAPTRATLTSVFFVNSRVGWAVGHDNTILQSTDGGLSWIAQYPAGHPGNSFLDVFFNDERQGFAVGAYGLFLETHDGGNRWRKREVFEEEIHFNRISIGPDGRIFLALEMGELLFSGDEGESWEELPSPYDGSLFGVLPLTRRTLLTFGLRGNLFRSTDGGETWQEIEIPGETLLMDAVRLADGSIVVAGQGGGFFVSHDAGLSFQRWNQERSRGTSVLIATPDGAVIAGGLNGVYRLVPPRES